MKHLHVETGICVLGDPVGGAVLGPVLALGVGLAVLLGKSDAHRSVQAPPHDCNGALPLASRVSGRAQKMDEGEEQLSMHSRHRTQRGPEKTNNTWPIFGPAGSFAALHSRMWEDMTFSQPPPPIVFLEIRRERIFEEGSLTEVGPFVHKEQW